jgi:hypothetical protein
MVAEETQANGISRRTCHCHKGNKFARMQTAKDVEQDEHEVRIKEPLEFLPPDWIERRHKDSDEEQECKQSEYI